MAFRILIVDDEPGVRFGLSDFLESHGFEALEAENTAEALTQTLQAAPDLVILDHQLPDGNSLDLLPRLKALDPRMPVFVFTAFATIELAVQAVKLGADQVLTKSLEYPSLLVMIRRSLEHRALERRLEGQAPRQQGPDPFIGRSPAIAALRQAVEPILDTHLPVLITGETGTGKSLLARWIHHQGQRRQEAFLDLNCAGLNKDFLENELFGHERGAFTGAGQAKQGLLEVAHQGTVFLDEVGDMDPAIQVKLLKVLEEKRFRRMGGLADRHVDIRLIAATHQDLPALMREGRFRSDLFYRLNTLSLHMPALRERKEDIEPLVGVLLTQIAQDMKRRVPQLTPAALATLETYGWPGNIRELRNTLERVCLYAQGRPVSPEDLNLPWTSAKSPTELSSTGLEAQMTGAIRREVERCGGNISEAARRLGISRSTIYTKMQATSSTPSEN